MIKNKYKIIIPEQTSELINKFHDLGLQNNDTHNFYGNLIFIKEQIEISILIIPIRNGNDINCNLKFGVDSKHDNFFNQFKNHDSIKEFCNIVIQKIVKKIGIEKTVEIAVNNTRIINKKQQSIGIS